MNVPEELSYITTVSPNKCAFSLLRVIATFDNISVLFETDSSKLPPVVYCILPSYSIPEFKELSFKNSILEDIVFAETEIPLFSLFCAIIFLVYSCVEYTLNIDGFVPFISNIAWGVNVFIPRSSPS